MSQKALYRKYRSVSFDEVLGQDHITDTLKLVTKSGNFGHAYLFTGPRGVGKTSVARLLAHSIIGQTYGGDTPEHIDIIEIDAASNTGVDDVRELREKAYVSPAASEYKVYIIDEVHMLSKAAFNALLKILEEPPAHVIFILATTETHKIPQTVISRTQRFGFRPIKDQLLESHIDTIAKKEKIKLDDGASKLIAQHGNGSFRDAISLLDQLSSQSESISQEIIRQALGQLSEVRLVDITEAIQNSDTGKIISSIEEAESDGAQVVEIAAQLAGYWRNLLVSGNSPFEAKKTLDGIERLLSVGRSTNPRLQLEVTLVRLCADNQPRNTSTPIQAAPKQQAPVAKPQSSVANITKPPASKAVERPEPTAEDKDNKDEPLAKGEPMTKPLNEAQWDKVLVVVKKSNHSLYALLRMCHMDSTDGKLSLHFGFPFHHKRMQDKRNQKILLEAINGEFGVIPELELVLDQTRKPELPKSAEEKAASGVLDIFGGESVSL